MNETELEKSFDANHRWAGWAAKIIVVGLGLDIVVLIALPEAEGWLHIGAAVFATLVITLGVAGEIFFEGRAHRAAVKLQRISNEKVSAANERASKADEMAARLRAHAAELRLVLLPRVLPADTDASYRELYDDLAKFAGTEALVFVVPDFASRRFAEEIVRALKEAGWTATLQTNDGLWNGVVVYSGKDGSPLEGRPMRAAQSLVNLTMALETMFVMHSHMQPELEKLRYPHGLPDNAVVVEVGLPDTGWRISMLDAFGPLGRDPQPKWRWPQ